MLCAAIFVVNGFKILAVVYTFGKSLKSVKLFLLLVVGKGGCSAFGVGRSKVFGNYVGDTVVFVHVFFNVGLGNGVSAVLAVNGGENLATKMSRVADIVFIRVKANAVRLVKHAVTVVVPVIVNVGVKAAYVLVAKFNFVFFSQNFGTNVLVNTFFCAVFNIIIEFNVAVLGGNGFF